METSPLSSEKNRLEATEIIIPIRAPLIESTQQNTRGAEYELFANANWMRRANQELIDRLPDLSSPHIVDAACGSGNPTGMLLERYPDAQILALDISQAMLMEASQKYAHDPRVRLAHADMTGLDEQEHEADIVSSFNAIHYLKDDQKSTFFASAARAMKAGGTVAVNTGFFSGAKADGTEMFYTKFVMDLYESLLQRIPSPSRDMRRNLKRNDPTPDAYAQMMKAAGFEITSCDVIEQKMTVKSLRDFFATDEVADAFFPTLDRSVAQEILIEAFGKSTTECKGDEIFPRSWLYLTGVKK